MITQEILDEYFHGLKYANFRGLIWQIDTQQTHDFILLLLKGYIEKNESIFFRETQEIDSNCETDTCIFITHIIEVGSLLIISENKIVMVNPDAIFITCLTVNLLLAKFFIQLELKDGSVKLYFNANAQSKIQKRVLNHWTNATFQNNYLTNILNNSLFSKISDDCYSSIMNLYIRNR